MPLVKIELKKGNTPDYLQSLIGHTMTAIQHVLQLPANDYNIRLMEFEHELFFMKEPYKIIIEISLFSGRTIDTKRKLYNQLALILEENLDIKREELFILLNEQPKQNWGVRGAVPASDIDLGFKVEI